MISGVVMKVFCHLLMAVLVSARTNIGAISLNGLLMKILSSLRAVLGIGRV